MPDVRQSKKYAHYLKLIGWIVKEADDYYVYIRKIPLTPFSIIKVQRPKKIPFKKINQFVKKYRTFQVTVEPDYDVSIHDNRNLQTYGYRQHKSPYLPTKTIHLNLTQTEEKILAQMKKDARYEIRKAKKEKLQLIKVRDLAKFHHAWKGSVGWQRYVPSLKSLAALKKAFGKNAIFLTGNWKLEIGNCLAGTVILITGKTAYYYHAFSSKEGREKSAQYLLVWEAIRLAKRRGCKIFDFEGIYDERFPIKSWKGFSHFKKSFGGREVKYPGCFVKYQLPF